MAKELPMEIDFDALERAKERNRIDRLKFIDFNVKWMQEHPDTWSKAQKELIDGQYGKSD